MKQENKGLLLLKKKKVQEAYNKQQRNRPSHFFYKNNFNNRAICKTVENTGENNSLKTTMIIMKICKTEVSLINIREMSLHFQAEIK